MTPCGSSYQAETVVGIRWGACRDGGWGVGGRCRWPWSISWFLNLYFKADFVWWNAKRTSPLGRKLEYWGRMFLGISTIFSAGDFLITKQCHLLNCKFVSSLWHHHPYCGILCVLSPFNDKEGKYKKKDCIWFCVNECMHHAFFF